MKINIKVICMLLLLLLSLTFKKDGSMIKKRERWGMTEYTVMLNEVPNGKLRIIYINGEIAIPLMRVYELTGASITNEGTSYIINLQIKNLSTGKQLILDKNSKTVFSETGLEMLFQAPGSENEVIRTWIENDFYVDEDSLFTILFLTTDWNFRIHPEKKEIVFMMRQY